MHRYNFETSKAFIKKLHIEPYQSGLLNNLTFAVKDLIDIADEVTGYGNPTWAATHSKAVANAICVEQLLLAGATCIGKTITDEFAYSLMGENHFYGTPINPKALDRVPGGSSSGSASAVACGLVDFALGTDTGGSVRVPASNCGIWGYRPSHGRISVAGVNPLAPMFDTVGVLAKNGDILKKVISVLLAAEITDVTSPNIFILDDIFKICDLEIQQAFLPILAKFKEKFPHKKINMGDITEPSINIEWLFNTYMVLQSAEIWNCIGPWIEHCKPELGPIANYNVYNIAKKADRIKIQECIHKQTIFNKHLNKFFNPGNKLLCFPTTPTLARKLGTAIPQARTSGTYYPRGINVISALARAPQITIPVAEINSIPIGFSLLAGYGQDEFLAEAACVIASELI